MTSGDPTEPKLAVISNYFDYTETEAANDRPLHVFSIANDEVPEVCHARYDDTYIVAAISLVLTLDVCANAER